MHPHPSFGGEPLLFRDVFERVIAIAVATRGLRTPARKKRVVDQTACIDLAELSWITAVDPLLEARILGQQLSNENKGMHGIDADLSVVAMSILIIEATISPLGLAVGT